MRPEQQAFTPIVGMTTDFHVDRYLADVEVAPDEGIENLSRRAVHVALHFIAVTIVVIAGGVAGYVTFHIVIVIGLVEPACTTEASTPLVEVRKSSSLNTSRRFVTMSPLSNLPSDSSKFGVFMMRLS